MSAPGKKMIDIIIATYKRPESLKKTLLSILDCTVNDQFDYTLIVADNNSHDYTKQIVEELMPLFHGKLKYIFEGRTGKSHALNTAIKNSSGEYIAMTDDDCLVDKEWLVNMVKALKVHPVDVLCGPVDPIFYSPLPSWIDLSNKIFHGPLVHYHLSGHYIDSSDKEILPPGANMVVRRSSYEKHNGFEQETRAQDTEFCHRWYREGAVTGYTPDLLVRHVTPDSRLNKKYFRQWQFLSGKNSATIFNEDFKKDGRKIFDVPLWVYKKLFKSIGRYLLNFFDSKNRFPNELWIHVHMGTIYGIRGTKVKFERL